MEYNKSDGLSLLELVYKDCDFFLAGIVLLSLAYLIWSQQHIMGYSMEKPHDRELMAASNQ